MQSSIWTVSTLIVGLMFTTSGAYSQSASDEAIIDEIVTTGTFIRRKSQADQTSPIDVIGDNNLDDIGAMSAVDIVATLPANNGAQNQSDGFNQSFSIGTTNVNLRGLGVSSTLTLLNGRRQTPTAATTLNGDQFVDLNSLVPAIAISQIEVLKDGASSLYGSDAVAAVVNFKTRNDFVGVELEANYAMTASDSQDDAQISALFGWDASNNVHLLGAISYFDRSGLNAGTRRDEFELRNALSIFSNPGTYLVFGATPGPPTRTVDPACAAQAASSDDINLIAAGPIAPTCQFDFGDFFALVAKEERIQLFTHADIEVGDSTDVFFEFGYADNTVISSGSPSQPILFPQIIPDTNPAAATLGIVPGGRALSFIRVDGAGNAPSMIDLEYESFRFAGGFVGDFTNGWGWETAVTYSENTFGYRDSSDTKIDRFVAAINGVGGPNNDQFFNPLFGATNPASVREDFRGTLESDAESTLLTLDGHITGEFGDLSTGSVGFAAGFQYRKDELSYDYSIDANNNNLFFFRGNQDFSGDKDVWALFVELDMPLSDTFSIQAALRYEDFGDVDTTDPKVGFLWRPADKLSLRGTFGTSFRAASLFQDLGLFAVPARVFDPVAGGLATISQTTSGDSNNPVGTQSSDVINIGVTWDDADSGWNASLDYWSFEYEDFITSENATALVAANFATGAFANQIMRDPTTNALLSVNTFFRNAGSLETDGLDLSVTKTWDTASGGSVTALANVTNVLSYDLEDPVIGQVDGLGQRNFTNFGVPVPELKGSLGLLWQSAEHHSANAFLRYITDYQDENNMNATIDSWTSIELQYRYQASAWGSFEQGPSITIGAKNIGDEMPPDVVSRTGYDALTHSPLGRQWYVSVRQTF